MHTIYQHTLILLYCNKSRNDHDNVNDTMLVAQDPTGHLFMKQLLQREAEAQKGGEGGANDGDNGGSSSASGAPWFADALLKQAGGDLSAWACKNRGGFVVAALGGVPSASAGVQKVLGAKAARARLVKDAKAGGSMGAKVCIFCARV